MGGGLQRSPDPLANGEANIPSQEPPYLARSFWLRWSFWLRCMVLLADHFNGPRNVVQDWRLWLIHEW